MRKYQRILSRRREALGINRPLPDRRREAADEAFDDCDTGPLVVTGAGPWREAAPDTLSCEVFARHGEASHRLLFTVRFGRGTAEAEEAYLASPEKGGGNENGER